MNKYKTICVHLDQMRLTGPVCLYMGPSQGFVSNTGSLSYSGIQAQEQIYTFSGFKISDYEDMRYWNKMDLIDHFYNDVITHKHWHIHLLYTIFSSQSKHFSHFFLPHCICQTVVNFISELQEQMCRFQKEINSKIQEKKALEIPADSSSPVACPTEPTEGQGSNPGPSCDRTSGVIHKLEEAPDGPDVDTHSLEEGSSDAEQPYHCGGESVGTACLHDF